MNDETFMEVHRVACRGVEALEAIAIELKRQNDLLEPVLTEPGDVNGRPIRLAHFMNRLERVLSKVGL